MPGFDTSIANAMLGDAPGLVTQPGLVSALASGRASSWQVRAVNQFVQGLELAKQVQLARNSGGLLNLSPSQKAHLDALGVGWSDVDASRIVTHPPDPGKAATEAGNWFQRTWHSVAEHLNQNPIIQNPFSQKVFHTLDRAWDIGGTPVRTVAEGGLLRAGGVDLGPLNNPIIPQASEAAAQNRAETARQMAAQGSSNNFFSTLAWYSHGEQVYGSLQPLRQKYGDQQVQDAVQFLHASRSGGDDWWKNMISGKSADEIARLMQERNDPGFAQVIKEVDANHLSPGRQVARSLGLRPGLQVPTGGLLGPGGKADAFNLVSGSVDAAANWFSDPTLILGKAYSGYKVASLGLKGALDAEGVKKIMDPASRNLLHRSIQSNWRQWLTDAKLAHSTDNAVAAPALARLHARSQELMPLVADVGGKNKVLRRTAEGDWKLVDGTPISTYDQLVDHLANTNAMVRLSNGEAAAETMLMPGAVGLPGWRRLKGAAAGRATTVGLNRKIGGGQRWVDLRENTQDFIPLPGASRGSAIPDDVAGAARQDQLDKAAARGQVIGTSNATVEPGMLTEEQKATAAGRGEALLNIRKYGTAVAPKTRAGRLTRQFFAPGAYAARARYAAQRIDHLIPTATHIVFDDPDSVEQVRRFALTFMPSSEANLITAQYLRGDQGARMAIAKSMLVQAGHAAGLPASVSGRQLMDKVLRDVESEGKQIYSNVAGADSFINPHRGDEAVHGALWEGQLTNGIEIPRYQDMRLHAAKASIWDYTGKKALESQWADQVIGTLKPLWMFTGSNFTRAILEDLTGMFLRGQSWDFTKARSAVASRNLMLSTFENKDEALGFVRKARGSVSKAVLLKTLRAQFHEGVADDDVLRALDRLGDDGVNEVLQRLTGSYHAQTLDPSAADELSEITKAGFTGRGLWYKWEKAGYGPLPTDGGRGAVLWSQNLHQRLTGSGMGEHALAMVLDPSLSQEEKIARHAAYLGSDAAKEFRRRAQRAAFTKDGTPIVAADGSIDAGVQHEALRDLARDQLDDMAYVVSQPDGTVNEHLADYLMRYGRPPTSDWIEKTVPDALRPSFAIGPEWIATTGKKDSLSMLNSFRGLTQAGFGKVIAEPVNKVTRSPIFLQHMVNAEKNLKGYKEALMAQGLTDDAAEAVLNKTIADHAYALTVKQVDDPELRTQLDVVGRNFVPFIRATNDFMRRWGRTFREDPTRVRKLQLLYEGGIHSGFITYDAEGNPQFTYPGSGWAIQKMIRAGELIGLDKAGISLVMLPVMSNLSTKVVYLNQSLDNPLSYTVSPLVSTPVNYFTAKLFPGSALGQKDLDLVMRGQLGAGRPWYESFMPTALRRFYNVMNDDERDSQLASAVRNTILHIDTGQQWDVGTRDLPPLPQDATADQVEDYLHKLKVGARNQLMIRAIFAMFAPGPPSSDMTVPDKEAADPIYRAQHIALLEDEFRKLVNDVGGDYTKALAVWTQIHPDKLAYAIGSTELAGKGTIIPATRQTTRWMELNQGFLNKYTKVGGYFIPIDQTGGEFNPQAWQAELEMGLRHHKTLDQFFTDVRVRGAETTYYAAKDARDKAVNEAVANGDKVAARNAKESFTLWRKGFLAYNPLFAEKQAQWSSNTQNAKNAVAELEQMLGDPSVPALPDLGGVRAMLDATSAHQQWQTNMAGVRSAQSSAMRQSEQSAYETYMQGIVKRYPGLKDLYNGVFRSLENQLNYMDGG